LDSQTTASGLGTNASGLGTSASGLGDQRPSEQMPSELVDIKRRNRRRLVGAITIAAVIAVVFPLAFKVEERVQRKELDLVIPTPNAVQPLPGPAGAEGKSPDAKSAKPSVQKAAEAKPAPAAVSAPTDVKPAEAKTPAVSPPAKAAEVKPQAAQAPLPAQAVARLGSFAVQLASLKDQESAKRLGSRVAENELSFFFERVATEQGELIRVRAGPFKTKDDAEKAQKKLAKAGIQGSVVNMQ
jgi:DedD protein